MRFRLLLLGIAVALSWARAGLAGDADALWKIVSGRCVPNQEQHADPAPCALVDLDGGVDRGYVVLKDRVGATQYLVIPTARVTGIESVALLAPGAANYFADAWRERHFTEEAAKRALPRTVLSLAVNSVHGRSQNQLHIHIDCVRADIREALSRNLAAIGDDWAPFPEPLAGHRYRAVRVAGETLDQANPFVLLADGVSGARAAMGARTLVAIGAEFAGGVPGFVLLDGRADLLAGDMASGEELQDHSCALARQ